MVDLDWKSKMISSDMPTSKSPKLSDKLHLSPSVPNIPFPFTSNDVSPASSSVCSAYDCYLRLPELRNLWNSKEFPNWKNESVLKPALQALEITFRFFFTILVDPRPYANRREWKRRLQSLATAQIEIIAMLCEDEEEDDETRGTAPLMECSSFSSSTSLLSQLANWYKSRDVARKILSIIDCEMGSCPYTLGLGEANPAGKPKLRYDSVCNPSALHSLKQSPNYDLVTDNYENQTLYTSHQILESWIYLSHKLLERVAERIEAKSFQKAASDCYAIERIWKLLADIEDLHVLMDPDDFLRLKNQLSIRSSDDSVPFCFRSTELVAITKLCKDLKHKVPSILGVEVDPKGGPRIQEAAMKLYVDKNDGMDRVHLLQALQAIESAMKRFFYAYKQVVTVVMGSLEAKGNRLLRSSESCDSLSQIFLEPIYYPSLDAAKTFLGYFWDHETGFGYGCVDRRTRWSR